MNQNNSTFRNKIGLLLILIFLLPSTSWALAPDPTYRPIEIYSGNSFNLSNWWLGANVHLHYEGFITDNFYKIKVRSFWKGTRYGTYHIDQSFIRIYYSNSTYYVFEILHVSPQKIILQRR